MGIEPTRTFRLDPHELFPSRSKVAPFDIHIVNNGKESARDILLNMLFDSAIASEHAKRSPRSVDGSHFGPEQDSGTSIIVCRRDYIDPHDNGVAELGWGFPFRPAEYGVLVEASTADVETLSVRLKLQVTTDPEVRRVPLRR